MCFHCPPPVTPAGHDGPGHECYRMSVVGVVWGICAALNLFYGVPAENSFHCTSLQVEAVRYLAREAEV